MKIKHLLLSGLLLASTAMSILPNGQQAQVPNPMNDQQEQVNKPANEPQWTEFIKNYVTSITAGTIIGSLTGYLSGKVLISFFANRIIQGKIENMHPTDIIFIIVTLCAERALRYNLVDATNDNFNEYSIKHHAGLMSDSAWLASWIVFLKN